jgi:diphthamide biosynthesis protein 3
MAFHDEVEIEGKISNDWNRWSYPNNLDFEFDEESETYYWPCPCGDKFQITKVKVYHRKPKIEFVPFYFI